MTLQEIYRIAEKKYRHCFSQHATLSHQAYRLRQERTQDIRSPFAIDRDRILYSGAYRRYQGKTQVIYFANLVDEEMSNRSLHTTYVSQISRTIGKLLGLNLELIEAIALGHDLGHTPFGHDGEEMLSQLCEEHNIGQFHHNIESLHIVDNISKSGEGLNLTFQVRDGIISHDGEVHNQKLKPYRNKREEDIQRFIADKKAGKNVEMSPATLEGCVVRISDTIAYIGQDIEDAIRFGFLTRKELPEKSTRVLGDNNSDIIDTLVKSVVVNSYDNDFVCFDDETSEALYNLKKFNYERIYTSGQIKKAKDVIQRGIRIMFRKYLNDLKSENKESKIYKHFLNHKHNRYLNSFNNAEKVRDFVATMTDRYFNEELKDFLVPIS